MEKEGKKAGKGNKKTIHLSPKTKSKDILNDSKKIVSEKIGPDSALRVNRSELMQKSQKQYLRSSTISAMVRETTGIPMSKQAYSMLAGGIEYLIFEVLSEAEKHCKGNKLRPEDLYHVLTSDPDLADVLSPGIMMDLVDIKDKGLVLTAREI
jgi:histone H3/H4